MLWDFGNNTFSLLIMRDKKKKRLVGSVGKQDEKKNRKHDMLSCQGYTT